MKTRAVIGLGCGDEGKGKVVSSLCSQFDNPLVIRYCGGQQAGHHVVLKDGREHIFSNFGSGTLQGHNTYWSKYCTVDPVGILNELDSLKEKGISPILYIDPQSPVTTPYEKKKNRMLDTLNQHGSCGVGVGQTIQREEDHYSLQMRDLFFPSVLKIKFDILRNYYLHFTLHEPDIEKTIEEFIENCCELVNSSNVYVEIPNYERYDAFIFEGSQGLLLDQHIGFFPHVTRANTGTKNILEMGPYPDVYLVTRAYQTRHGNGPMTNENLPHKILPNIYENNSDSSFQGKFRTSILDADLLLYAIKKDDYINRARKCLVITCLDLVEENYLMTINGKLESFKTEDTVVKRLGFVLWAEKIFLSRTPFPELETFAY